MKWTIRALAILCVVLFTWYLVADRITPYTSNARVKAIVVDAVPQVSGYIAALAVTNGQIVEAGDLLARIDQRNFLLEVDRARSALQSATQNVGAGAAGVDVAKANLAQAQSVLENAQMQSERIFDLEEKDIVTVARGDEMRAQLAAAQGQVAAAEADLKRAQRELGTEGADNPQIQAAVAQLREAELALEWTELRAPARGTVINLTIGEGTFAQAGKPLITFASFDEVWVEANMTENNLGRVKVGQPVEITLDVAPGRIYNGVVASITPGAAAGSDAPNGLPRVQDEQAWMRDAQRFPVRISMTGYEIGSEKADIHRFLNGQADVIIYTSDSSLLNTLGEAWIRLNAWISYAY